MSLRSVSSLAALLCAALLLCLYRPRVPTPAHAAGKDEIVWRGTVTVVDTVNLDKDETNQGPIGVDGGYGTNHHINREQSRRSYRYSGIRAAPDSETSWSGPADVNLNIDAHTYNMDHETVVLPAYVKYNRITNSEHGFEATTSGATVAQGVVKFYRNRKEDDPRKAECRIEVDADEDWRDRPELTVWMVGKGWEKGDNNHSENEQKTRQILAPHFVGIDFDCDPEASSYSGEQREHAAGSPDTHVVTWNIHGGPDPDTEVELIPPKEYDQWRPEGGEDETTLGDFIDVRIVAHKKGDPNADPPKRVLKYKISLEGTSRKIGVDLNWPHNAKERSEQIHLPLDMKIDEVNPWIRVTSDEGQTAETKEEGLTDFMVTVNSYDWAGHTKLRVIAELEGSDTVVAHVQGHPEQEELLIPKDENHNDIADGWERQNGVYGADVSSDDDDDPPGSGNGDAIALYDEYRGFHVGGQHEGLSPHKKDLFVYDADGLGVGVYGNSGIRVHVIKDGEFSKKGGHPNPYVVTPNGEHGDVCAIYLHRGPLDSGVIGETLGANDVPCNILGITIDPTVSDGLGKEEGPSYLQSSIAHELSHATKVSHHGPNDLDYVVGDATCQGKAGVENIPCLTPPDKKTGKTQMASDCYEVAVKGGKFSGNAQCWMRYDQTNFYEDPTGNCEWEHNGKTVRGRKYGADPPGMTLCENPRGTGVNDPAKTPNKAGDATFGNCRKQLTLK